MDGIHIHVHHSSTTRLDRNEDTGTTKIKHNDLVSIDSVIHRRTHKSTSPRKKKGKEKRPKEEKVAQFVASDICIIGSVHLTESSDD